MTDYDIDRVEKHLPDIRERMKKEDWIGQARRLIEEGAGETA